MRLLKECGFEDLVIGFETGDNETLEYVNKGYNADDILTGCKRLEEAGVDYRMIFLGGLSGKGNCEKSALKTAEILNQLHPYLMYLNSVSVLPGTKLYEEVQKGLFQTADEKELVMEFITLLQNMKNEIAIFAAPNTTPFSFFVNLQPVKEELLEQMRKFADGIDEKEELKMSKQRNQKTSV